MFLELVIRLLIFLLESLSGKLGIPVPVRQ